MNGTRRHLNRSYGTKKGLAIGGSFFLAGIASMRSGTCHASALVRIRRPKIGVLAHQTQGARITERSGVTRLSSPHYQTCGQIRTIETLVN